MAGPSWEDVRCPICGDNADSSLWLTCGDRLSEPRLKNYRIVRCSGCGLGFLNPRPDAATIGNSYREEGYDPFLSLSQPRSLTERIYRLARRWTLGWKRRLTVRLVQPGGAVLDVGCGTGEYLNAIKDAYHTTGVEPDERAALWAQRNYKLTVLTGDAFHPDLPDEGYDLVTLWHSLEHTFAPVEVMRRVRGLLKPGGTALIALPNHHSLDAALYADRWVPLDAPRHLWHFAPNQIKKLASITGFKLIRSGMLPLDTFYNVLMSEQLALRIGASRLIAPLRMCVALIGSLIWGGLSGSHSGMVYLLKKFDGADF